MKQLEQYVELGEQESAKKMPRDRKKQDQTNEQGAARGMNVQLPTGSNHPGGNSCDEDYPGEQQARENTRTETGNTDSRRGGEKKIIGD